MSLRRIPYRWCDRYYLDLGRVTLVVTHWRSRERPQHPELYLRD